MLTPERLREVLRYDPNTGAFTWLVQLCSRAVIGAVAGCNNGRGRSIRIDGKIYLAHRLAWVHVHGVWPPHDIDHMDGNPLNNRIANLRLATRGENLQNRHGVQINSTSGATGVSWHERAGKWRAEIKLNRRIIHLGLFDDFDDAIEYRELAQAMLHPYSKAAERLPTFTLAEWQPQ